MKDFKKPSGDISKGPSGNLTPASIIYKNTFFSTFKKLCGLVILSDGPGCEINNFISSFVGLGEKFSNAQMNIVG